MKAGDPFARNLFARLSSSVPTEGQDRVENYCTEGLAWCLLKCGMVRRAFFNLCRKKYRSLPELPLEQLAIASQVVDEELGQDGGIADLVLATSDIGILIEVKVDSKEGMDEFAEYEKWSQWQQKPILFLLTKHSQCSPNLTPSPHGHISWSEVAFALSASSDPMVLEFRDFLQGKGIAMKNLPRLQNCDLGAAWKTVQLFESWATILNRVQEEVLRAQKNAEEFQKLRGRSFPHSELSEGKAWFYFTVSEASGGAGFFWDNERGGAVGVYVDRFFKDRKEAERVQDHIRSALSAGQVLPLRTETDGRFYLRVTRKLDRELDGDSLRISEWMSTELKRIFGWLENEVQP